MRFFNIDKGLELPQKYKIIMEAMDELYAKRQEDFQKSNPIKEIYQMVNLDRFQRSFNSTTGFKKAFEQTVDYAAYPGFTNGDGFKATISYKAFNGKIVFTWQMILEADAAAIRDDLSQYQIAWQRQLVEFAMFALTAMFGEKKYDKVSKTYLKIDSADTVDGDPMTAVKNPVFCKEHNVVRREDMTDEEFNSLKQSNKFFINVKLDGSDPLAYAKLANALNQIKVIMAKYYDDNGKRAGVTGRKKLVMTEDAQLSQAIDAILAATDFTATVGKPCLNPVKGGFDKYTTPYLDGNIDQPIPQFAVGADNIAHGILMLDNEYNKANHGPMMVERLGFSMKAVKTDEPEGIKYLGKQAFDFFCPSWRGIAYIYIGNPADIYNADNTQKWANPATFTEIKPVAFAQPVQVVNKTTDPVNTKSVQ